MIYRTPEGVAMVLDVNVRTQSNAHILNNWFSSVKQSEDTQTGQILGFLGEHYTPKKGVLAGVYNHMTKERSAFFGLLNALNDVLFKDKITEGVLILIGALLMMMFQVFISGVLQVGYCRFLLENRIYGQVRLGRLTFPWRVNRWKNTMLIMLKKYIFLFLWDYTIIGGFIKRYSYKMIPYIVAENPEYSASGGVSSFETDDERKQDESFCF